MIIFTLIVAAAALLAFLAFAAVVLGIHATERRHALRQPGYGRIDTFTRRFLGVYTRRQKTKAAQRDDDEFIKWLTRR